MPDIVRMTSSHLRSDFDCGEPTLDLFIRTQASQYEKRRLGNTYAAIDDANVVVGYYTLAAGSLGVDERDSTRSKLPRHPIPIVLLARLAVTRAQQGSGLGFLLLQDAVRHVLTAANVVAVHALVVDALHDRAAKFYIKHGFTPVPQNLLKLYISIKTLQQANS